MLNVNCKFSFLMTKIHVLNLLKSKWSTKRLRKRGKKQKSFRWIARIFSTRWILKIIKILNLSYIAFAMFSIPFITIKFKCLKMFGLKFLVFLSCINRIYVANSIRRHRKKTVVATIQRKIKAKYKWDIQTTITKKQHPKKRNEQRTNHITTINKKKFYTLD